MVLYITKTLISEETETAEKSGWPPKKGGFIRHVAHGRGRGHGQAQILRSKAKLIVRLFKIEFNIQFRSQWPQLSMFATGTLFCDSWSPQNCCRHYATSTDSDSGVARLPLDGAAGNPSQPRFTSTTALSTTDSRRCHHQEIDVIPRSGYFAALL
jgi:hypothetical protein